MIVKLPHLSKCEKSTFFFYEISQSDIHRGTAVGIASLPAQIYITYISHEICIVQHVTCRYNKVIPWYRHDVERKSIKYEAYGNNKGNNFDREKESVYQLLLLNYLHRSIILYSIDSGGGIYAGGGQCTLCWCSTVAALSDRTDILSVKYHCRVVSSADIIL
ncbi:hypothetical protein QTP88_019596 [Uroleucon formosanum]